MTRAVGLANAGAHARQVVNLEAARPTPAGRSVSAAA